MNSADWDPALEAPVASRERSFASIIGRAAPAPGIGGGADTDRTHRPERRPTMDEALKETTKKTARMLFHTVAGGTGFETWKKFDKDLARELSMFFTGKLYSREVISQKQRELCAVASLTVLNRTNEVRAHVHAALNVGATRQEIAEVIFQQVTYGGMPVVVEALEVFRRVLEERGEWEA
jgi:4-carboxymuconolactone decarboxylase